MIAGIVLAAGEAKRLGQAKQLLDWHGEPLVRAVVKEVIAGEFDLVRVVVGAYAQEVTKALSGLGVEIVTNLEYALGQSTSVKCGLMEIPEGIKGAGFILADQPLIKAETYKFLIRTFLDQKPGILIPQYMGRRGNPIFFQREFFHLLEKSTGDQGGRWIIRQYADMVLEVAVNDSGILLDIDVSKDYKNLLKMSKDI